MVNHPEYHSTDEVLTQAKTANGHKVGDFNVNSRCPTGNKGFVGQVVEEGVFGYPINSKPQPDFENLGLELKVTGVKELKNKELVAKERLVLNLIDYYKEADTTFLDSSFWNKNKNLLLMFYKYDDNLSPEQFVFLDSTIFNFPDKDLEVIKKDWSIINTKIKNGQAELISEADTMYLAACTKGADSNSFRKQPYSNKLARQRAYCLKNSYLNSIINGMFLKEKYESILSEQQIKESSFEIAISSIVKKYVGWTEEQLLKEFDIDTNAKNKFEIIFTKMLGIKGKLNKCEEFSKANIVAKTIRVEENGRIKESMSFPTFKFSELIHEDWETSNLRRYFSENKYLFVVFQKSGGVYKFKKVKLWNMPLDILDEKVFDVWNKTKQVILEGNIIKGYTYMYGEPHYTNNFPGLSFNGVCHVRPHAKNSEDTFDLPMEDKRTGITCYPKQCFWLNAKYIEEVIRSDK